MSDTGMSSARETVVVVVVTYNRAELLAGMLDGLAAQTHHLDGVIVVDNASSDGTADLLASRTDLPLQVIALSDNTGGAGGFHRGLEAAREQAFDRMWLMDDDVVPAPDCLQVLMDIDEDCLMAVREDREGRLVEKSALRFDLSNPFVVRPKTAAVDTTYSARQEMPALVPVENVAFEGFMVRRSVVQEIGLPDPSFFIFYDDCDYALRAREAGRTIWAVRDAVLVRQLAFDQQHALDGWKGYYMYRNLFTVHFRHGENALVRAKPWAITAAAVALSPVRGGKAEAGNVIRAMRDARKLRRGAVVRGPRG